jgi:exodeoxyribonuclease X
MTKFRVIDFETTGFKTHDTPAQIVEFGFYDIGINANFGVPFVAYSHRSFVRSSVPCSIGARATHHITDEEIQSGIPVEHALLKLSEGAPDYYVAHNAEYEQSFFTGGQTPWICTYKCALRLWPDAEKHNNQFLRYYLDLPCDPELSAPPHRALPDAYVTSKLLLAILDAADAKSISLDDLVRTSSNPPLPTRINFGQYAGRRWDELPPDYLQWIADKSSLDANTKWAARHYLKAGK